MQHRWVSEKMVFLVCACFAVLILFSLLLRWGWHCLALRSFVKLWLVTECPRHFLFFYSHLYHHQSIVTIQHMFLYDCSSPNLCINAVEIRQWVLHTMSPNSTPNSFHQYPLNLMSERMYCSPNLHTLSKVIIIYSLMQIISFFKMQWWMFCDCKYLHREALSKTRFKIDTSKRTSLACNITVACNQIQWWSQSFQSGIFSLLRAGFIRIEQIRNIIRSCRSISTVCIRKSVSRTYTKTSKSIWTQSRLWTGAFSQTLQIAGCKDTQLLIADSVTPTVDGLSTWLNLLYF